MGVIGSFAELTAQGAVELVVPNLRTALDFYLRLGFTIERETPRFVTLRWDGMYFFVAQDDAATSTPRWTNVRIVVDNVDKVWDHVQRNHLPVGNPIGDRPYGLRDFTVRDPAGFEVRFAQVIA